MTPVSYRLDPKTINQIKKRAKLCALGNQTEYIRRLVDADRLGLVDWHGWTQVSVRAAIKEMERAQRQAARRRRKRAS